MLSHVSLFAAPCTVTCWAPLPMEFSRQEEWRGLPILLQRIIPTQGPSLHLFCLLYWQVYCLPQHHPGNLGNYIFKAPSPSTVDIHSYCELGFQHTRKCRLPRWLSGKESACNAESRVRSLDWKDPLEEDMAIYSSILAGIILKTNIKLHIGQMFKKK